jgi:phosphoribosyl-ATP pyrophosphohydrolase/phosphoribosyl-AMP cyclohydrolase
MNKEAYERSQATGLVTFYSRSKGRLWVKGESSGNYLSVVSMYADCDRDAVLVKARPRGPVCHTGALSCFGEQPRGEGGESFLRSLTHTIKMRAHSGEQGSYTAELFEAGIDRIAQKVGEEAIEVVIEGKNGDTERLLEEAADLLFHLMVLLEWSGRSLDHVIERMQERVRQR